MSPECEVSLKYPTDHFYSMFKLSFFGAQKNALFECGPFKCKWAAAAGTGGGASRSRAQFLRSLLLQLTCS